MEIYSWSPGFVFRQKYMIIINRPFPEMYVFTLVRKRGVIDIWAVYIHTDFTYIRCLLDI